ncbi:MAG TPA: TetR/AcrR family transcriptional regulator [Acidimicrobiales bacterium]|nr:TetR/AcrR family transcriptional regulator [Acidimicrobiales bacterium]
MPERGGGSDGPRWITEEDAPARPPLTRRRIVMAGLALVESEGLEALTMRRLAATLGVTPMSLYNHVADKGELIDVMLDYVIGDIVKACAEDQGTWEERLRALVWRNYHLWRQHPGLARIYTEGVTMGPNGMAQVEYALGVLREAGFNDEDAADAFYVLWHYQVSSVLVARARPVDAAMRTGRSDGTRESRIRLYFSALPMSEIPNVVALAGHLDGGNFEFGLDIILSGLRARLAGPRAPAKAKKG